MNTTELAKAVAEDTGLTQKQAQEAIRSVTHHITESLRNQERVQVHGFGVFDTKLRKSQKLNPLMGGGTLPERTTPVFRPSKTLKESVDV